MSMLDSPSEKFAKTTYRLTTTIDGMPLLLSYRKGRSFLACVFPLERRLALFKFPRNVNFFVGFTEMKTRIHEIADFSAGSIARRIIAKRPYLPILFIHCPLRGKRSGRSLPPTEKSVGGKAPPLLCPFDCAKAAEGGSQAWFVHSLGFERLSLVPASSPPHQDSILADSAQQAGTTFSACIPLWHSEAEIRCPA